MFLTIPQSGPRGAQQAGSWSCRESFIAVCVSNIPVIYPSVARLYHRMGFNSTHSKFSGPSKSYRLGPTNEGGRRKSKKLSPYSIPDTVTGSTDRINMIPNGTTRIAAGDEMGLHRGFGNGSAKNDIRVFTEIDVESLQKPETMPAKMAV